MDELIHRVMQDLNIEEKFIENQSTYNIIKHYIRIKLKDLYSYYLYKEAKDDIECSQSEIIEGLKKENGLLVDIDRPIDIFEIRMIKYFKNEMKELEKWNETISKIRRNMKILEKTVRIVTDKNKLFISYKAPWEKENVIMFYDEYSGNIDVKKSKEKVEINDDQDSKQESLCIINEKYNSNGERISVKVKDFGDKVQKENAKKQVKKLKREYYDNIFQKLYRMKNKGGAKTKAAVSMLFNRLIAEQDEETDINKSKEER